MDARHIVLAGDSIFDNDAYVLGERGVIEQMRRALPPSWSASKIAVDGDCIGHIPEQLAYLPAQATDLVVSVGGNDVGQYQHLLLDVQSLADLPSLMAEPLAAFRTAYHGMIDLLAALDLRTYVCPIYSEIPFEDAAFRQYASHAIKAFNAAIIAEAESRSVPVIRLDRVCVEAADFAAISPIEPSCQGGQKIVDHILASLAKRR